MRILVTRAREQASELARRLADAGAQPVEYPVIRTAPLPPAPDLRARLRRADWIVFTSANGLPGLLHQLDRCHGPLSRIPDVQTEAHAPISPFVYAAAPRIHVSRAVNDHVSRVDYG